MAETASRIYFSDFFNLDSAALEQYGAFNISLINDLPLFIDPFLLFDNADNAKYTALHDDIIRYVKFLRDVCKHGAITEGHFKHWFYLPELRQNWLGFSKTGNGGSGLGHEFAVSLRRNLTTAFADFGNETITKGSHLEKLCLLGEGVGRDRISDFTANLIKPFLLQYTQTFARDHIDPSLRRACPIEKVMFHYGNHRWLRAQFDLPVFNSDYVILTPKDILTKDESWINRSELLDEFQYIYQSLPNDQLRDQVNYHFATRLVDDPSQEEVRAAAAATIAQFPEILDQYIKYKEDRGADAHTLSKRRVEETEIQFIVQLNNLVANYLRGSEFYSLGDSFDESLQRVQFLKDVIENKDGYRLFYVKGKPIHREADLQIMYRLTWYATTYDVNREVNNGRGPVDFKISRGSPDKTLVEFKLASNKKLRQNLQNQVPVYEAANDTAKSIKAILFYTEAEGLRLHAVLKELGLLNRRDVVVIDARDDNKPSGSIA